MTTYIIVIATAFALSFVMALWGWWVRGMEIREERWVKYEPYQMIDLFDGTEHNSGIAIEKIERLEEGCYIKKIADYKIYTN